MDKKHQGIVSKTLLIVCTVVVVFTVAFLLIIRTLVTSRFEVLEREEAAIHLERIIKEVNNSLGKVETTVSDWAPWDETYAFVKDRNKAFKANNLSAESFQNLDIHFMLFFNARDVLVYSQFYDLEKQQTVEGDPAVVDIVKATPQLFQFASAKERKSGIALTSSQPVIVASAPIVTSTFTGPPRGTLVVGRYVDASLLRRISEQTELPLRMHRYAPEHQALFFAPLKTQQAPSSAAHPKAIANPDQQTLHGYTLFTDLAGTPALMFEITLQRNFFRQGLAMWNQQAVAMTVMGVLYILVLGLLLNKIILQRLVALSQGVAGIANAARHDLRVTVPGRDEIGELAGQINGMLSSLEQLQDLQSKNERYLKQVIDSVSCGIMIIDPENRRIVSINQAGAAMLQRTPGAITGQVCHRFICPREMHQCPVLDEGKKGNLSERAVLLPDGSHLPVLKSVVMIEQEGKSYLIESFIDISALKAVQAELQASELKYRQFFEEDLTGNFVCDQESRILDCNPTFAHILGFQTVDEVIGLMTSDFYHESVDRALLRDLIKEKGKVERYEATLRQRNGQLVYCICNILGEFNEAGEITGGRGYIFDDTKRVVLEQEARRMQKMEAIGTMAGGIAHDFNNILAGIIGFTEIVLRNLGEQHNAKDLQYLRNILSAGERARGLINKILTFSRQTEMERRPLSVQRTINDVLQLIRVSLPSTITIECDLDSQASVLADPIQLHQVFMNLCTNAGHAMKERGGVLRITLDEVFLDADFTGRYPEIVIGEYVRIEVADTGKGIPARLLGRIFDPFFTTKKKGEGTGLGLSMVHGIISAMHGLITVDSQEEHGTSFTLYLPRIRSAELLAAVEQAAVPIGHEHIVYVDDEEFLVDIGAEILRALGYQVKGFTKSDEALLYIQEHASVVDLVISDMTMPHFTGLELAQELQKLENPPPVIICTGHAEGLSKADVAALGVRDLLLKPVTTDTLAVATRAVLDR